MRLLVAEDDRDLNESLCRRLKRAGHSVDSCFDGDDATDYINAGEFDAVIMDIMMPKKDGLEALREIRASGNLIPVLLLTAKDTTEDIIKGLDTGAQDYMVKPFVFEELLARLRSITRKADNNPTNIFIVGDLSVDISSHTVKRGETEIELSAREFNLLEYLIRNKGKVLSRERIENNVWSFDYAGGTNVVDVYIWYLRKKIDDPFKEKLIHTVRGNGYVLRCENE